MKYVVKVSCAGRGFSYACGEVIDRNADDKMTQGLLNAGFIAKAETEQESAEAVAEKPAKKTTKKK